MFSVFSDKKFSDKIRKLKKCAGSSFTRDLIAGPKDERLWMLKPAAIVWLSWINNKILFELPTADIRTINVRIRIATSMLNKLEQNNIIPKDICIEYHKRLVERTNFLLKEILVEDLPF